MCQICDVIGIRKIIVPKKFSAKLKDKIKNEIEDPILERVKENIKYRLGNAIEFSSTSTQSKLNNAIDALFNRDYKEKKQIFVPELFLTKNSKMMFHGSKEYKETLAKRIEQDPDFSKKQKKPDSDKEFVPKTAWECQNANVEGEALEKTVYDALKSFFQGEFTIQSSRP